MPPVIETQNFVLRDTKTFNKAFTWISDTTYQSGILVIELEAAEKLIFAQPALRVGQYFLALGGTRSPQLSLAEGRHLVVFEDYGPYKLALDIDSQTFPITIKVYEYLQNGEPVTMTAEEIRDLLASLIGEARLGIASINVSGLTLGWGSITSKPSTFAPTSHQHAWADITNPPDIGGGNSTPSWSSITGKPETFTPSTHGHPWSSITDVPDLTSYVTIPATPWSSITGKPSTFSPETHTHSWADITDPPNIGGETGAGGSLEYVLVNASRTLTASGFYFTADISANILASVSSPPRGFYVKWLNRDTDKKVFLGGFSSINGTTIPTNQGIAIAPNSNLEFFTEDSSGSVRTLSGNFSIYYLPGNEPPTVTFTRQSAGDTNGVFYYLGTAGLTTGFTNPATTGAITATTNTALDVRTAVKCFDRDNNGNSTIWHSNDVAGAWCQVEFKNNQSFRVTGFELWSSDQHSLDSLGSNAKLQASLDGSTWTDIVTFSATAGGNVRYFNNSFTNNDFYTYYRFYCPNSGYHIIGDIEFYGLLQV
jgi:hypothetical protein